MCLNEPCDQDRTALPSAEMTLQWELQMNHALKKLSGTLLTAPDDLRHFAALILQTCLRLTDSSSGLVTQIDCQSGDHLALSYCGIADDIVPGVKQAVRFDAHRSGVDAVPWQKALATAHTAIFGDDADDGRMLAAPVFLNESLAGHIVMAGASSPYAAHHLQAVEQIGELYALALQRHQMEDEKIGLVSRLQQAQKMEAIGTLAGGIAHDFNNILFPIIGYTEMAMCDGVDDDMRHKYLNETLKAANRARELVQQILTFSRQDQQEKMPLRIQSIVKEAIKLLRSSLPATIDIRLSVDDQCGQILADPSQIHQIIMNLSTNAYHAMREKGGMLTIDLSPVSVGERDRDHYTEVNPGRYIKLTVTDTGHGMPQNVVDRIFDPYFTTKTNGEGSGLGLSVVHGIVKNCNGFISVDSIPGKGTVFTLFFPLIPDEAERRCQTAANQLPMGSERILLVDDEEQIVEMERQILERLGYTVFSATNGIEALQMFNADPQQIDLVITDQTMPKMTGLDLAGRLLAVRSDLPVILSTGLSEASLGDNDHGDTDKIRAIVYKPLVIKDLACTIRQILDQPPSGR